MRQTQEIPIKKKSDTRTYLLICLFIAVPVYWAALFYIETVTHLEDEALAFAATVCFFVFLYAGWRLSEVYTPKNRRAPELLFVLLAVIVVSGIIWLFFHADFPLRGRSALNLLLFWMPYAILSLALGMLIRLIRITIKKQLDQAYITAEQSRSELHLLQSQLSPHFLFNTLNNLYGLSLTQHEKIPTLLLKLADLLRYTVYDAKELFVPLRSELAYIKNYVDFERIRMGDRLRLTMAIELVADDSVVIAPMLLIVFIENAFKHSKNTADKEVFIEITLKTWADSILFSVKNSHSGSNGEHHDATADSGLGLVNVRKRLQLLYDNSYDLKIDDKDGFYNVQLQLKVR